MYRTVSAQDERFLIPFGKLCSTIKRLPDSAVILARLVRRDDLTVAPGKLMDVWRGKHRDTQVAIKVFRAFSAQSLEEAKKVRVE